MRGRARLEVLEDIGAFGDAVLFAKRMSTFQIRLHGKVVLSDWYSHQSGSQRGRLTCANGQHESCSQDRFVDEFAGHRECASWLAAWESTATDYGDRKAHLQHEPREATVFESLTICRTASLKLLVRADFALTARNCTRRRDFGILVNARAPLDQSCHHWCPTRAARHADAEHAQCPHLAAADMCRGRRLH